jgi:hypothetical protein
MVAPRKGEVTMGPFNWATVLRHEYTHTITLAATDNRIPHSTHPIPRNVA